MVIVGPAADPEVCLGEMESLWTAIGADALHRVLALQPGSRSSADAFEPMGPVHQASRVGAGDVGGHGDAAAYG